MRIASVACIALLALPLWLSGASASSAPAQDLPETVQGAIEAALADDPELRQLFTDRELVVETARAMRQMSVAKQEAAMAGDCTSFLCRALVAAVGAINSNCSEVDALLPDFFPNNACVEVGAIGNALVQNGGSYLDTIGNFLEQNLGYCTFNPTEYPCYCIAGNTLCGPPGDESELRVP